MCFVLPHQFWIAVKHIMGMNKEGNNGGWRGRLKRFAKPFQWTQGRSRPAELSTSDCTRGEVVLIASMEPEKIEADPSPSPEQKLQASREIGLWERAAGCLVPEDRDKLENLIRSKHKPAQCYEQDSPANDVESTLQNAQDLKKEKEGTWRPVRLHCFLNANEPKLNKSAHSRSLTGSSTQSQLSSPLATPQWLLTSRATQP